MKRKQVMELKASLLRIASDIDELKELTAIYKDDMAIAHDIYNETRSYNTTSLRGYAESCDLYLEDEPEPVKTVRTLHIDDRDERMKRAEELAEMWVGGAREHRRTVVNECMAEAGMMAAVIGNMLGEHYERAQDLLSFCEDCELAE